MSYSTLQRSLLRPGEYFRYKPRGPICYPLSANADAWLDLRSQSWQREQMLPKEAELLVYLVPLTEIEKLQRSYMLVPEALIRAEQKPAVVQKSLQQTVVTPVAEEDQRDPTEVRFSLLELNR